MQVFLKYKITIYKGAEIGKKAQAQKRKNVTKQKKPEMFYFNIN